ncbi:MAG TPA: PAS domain S-box protein [Burkholderiales bacterium]|nr:PAS domain S-box protein [Burkholderiales bacterium]
MGPASPHLTAGARAGAQAFALWASVLTMVFCLVAFAGWLTGSMVLAAGLPGTTPMKINTAVGLCLLACAVMVNARVPRPAPWVAGLAATGGLIGAATTLQYLLQVDLGIDQLLLADPTVPALPGRMAPLSAAAMASLALAILLRRAPGGAQWLRQAFAILPFICGVLGLIGLLYGFRFLTGLGVEIAGMAAATALALMLLGAAVLALDPDAGLMRIILADRAGGRFARVVLPIAIAFPIAVGWLRLLGEKAGLYDTAFGILILVLSAILVFSLITVIGASRLSDSEDVLLEARQALERRVQERTTDLEATVAQLRAEIALREAAEASQAETQAALRNAIDYAPIGMAIVGLDGRWQRVNRALCAIVGYDEATLLGKTFQDITHPDDLDADLALVDSLLAGEVPSYQMEKRYLRADGGSVWVLLSVSLVRDAASQPLFFVTQVEDISQRRQAERELAASRQFLRDIIDSLPLPLTVKDEGSRILVVNSAMAAFHGRPAEALDGRTDADLFPPERARQFRAEDEALLRTGIPFVEEQQFVTIGGEARWVIKRKHRILLQDGRRCVLTTLLDITARKAAEIALKESEERFRSLTVLSSDWYWEQDEQFRFTVQSGGLEVAMGIKPEQALGKARWELPYVNMSEADWARHRHVLEMRQPYNDLELVRELPDGSRRHAIVSGEPIYDGDGVFRGYRGTGRDVTAQRNAEFAVAGSRRFLEAIIEAIPQPVFVKDKDHRWVVLNTEFANMMGRPREELLGQTDSLLLPPGRVREVWAEDDAVIEGEGSLVVEERGRPRADGSVRWQIKSKRRVTLPDQGTCIVGTITDITRLKQVEEALRTSDELHRLLADNSSDLISLLTPAGVIEYASTASLPLLGRTPDRLTGRLVTDLIHPEDRNQALQMFQGVVRTQVTAVFTCRLQKADGSWSWIETSFRAIPDAGNPARSRQIIAVSRDVNERMRVTAALNHFKYVLDNTLDMIFIYDVDTLRLNYVNEGAARALGIPRERLIGMAPWEVRADMRQQDYAASIEPFLSGRITSRQVETVYRRPDGSLMPVEVTMQLVRRPGESGTFISVARDLTERKKVEQMKNEFISTVSHELRTPVTSIRGSLGLLAGGVAGELTKQARELVDIATSNSERLILLINDILDIEKIESGKMRFNLGPVRLREVLDTALQANRGYAQRFGVELVLAGEAPDITVTADGDRLLQVLANLLSNAAKFSPAGGKVEVSAARRGDGVRVQVRDHGSGIPADFQDKIFGKFSQADSSDTRRLGGTGLGLSIAKAIVEKHGGAIGFETAPGAGTTFHFDLPLAPPAVERAESAGQASG